MANLQESERDFIGSEINAIEAIRILNNTLETSKKTYLLWSLHNLIGIVSGQVERYDKAIEYHNKAIEYSKKIKDNYILQLYSKTNIAILNRRKGNYIEAVRQFNNILSDQSIKEKDPSTYASLLSALAYTKFLKNDSDDVEIESLFRESLQIAKKEGDEFEVMTASEYFAEYFLKRKNNDSAKFYANQTYELAMEVSENKTLLNGLLLKAKIEKGEKAKDYFFKHIKLSDSLLLSERVIRNKFARIDYETDEIKKENEVITRQRLWLIIITYSLLVTFVSVYIIIIQQQKNKVLKFTQSQQEANEEIYNLMLTQKNEVEEIKASERKRISRDLHDGVLGRLFGARLSLDSLNLDSSEKAIKNRGIYIGELKDIEHDLRKVSHKLNEDFITNSSYFDILKELVERQTKAYNLEYAFNVNSEVNWDLLSNKKKIHLYRIFQETLQNINKHSKATQIEITIEQNNFFLSLSIKDNGIGFDLKRAKKGIGFKNMKSRLKEINGKLIVESKENEGTLILFEIKN
jgi:signal transduction histidine kinase